MNTREDVVRHKFHELIMVTVALPLILAWSLYEMQHSGGVVPMFVFIGSLQGVILVPFAWVTRWWENV